MKTALKYPMLAGLTIVALIWPPPSVRSTEEEGTPDMAEKPAAREAFRLLQLQDENGQIPLDAWTKAYEQKAAMPFLPEAWREFPQEIVAGVDVQTPSPLPWASIGPENVGGRIRSIIIHPANPGIIWVGGVSGGIWKTINGGTSWSTNTDFLANLAVSCMAIDPVNSNILYAGTGEGVRGNGIFKTTDGGSTWLRLNSTKDNPDFYYINRLAISPSPTSPQILLAGTGSGIFRSEDGGEHWSQRPGTSGQIWDVLFHPTDGNNCIAGSRGGNAYYSTNGGSTWAAASWSGAPPSGSVKLAYSRSNPLIVYASTEANSGQLHFSSNGGHDFVSRGSCCTTAVGYANSLWVDPTNSNTVIFGGVSLFRSTDGGATGALKVYINAPHADHQVIVEHPGYNGGTVDPANKIVFCGTDGGIHQTNDILASPSPPPPLGVSFVSWTTLNHNLGITQFYGAAGNVATGKIIGGTQDNGTLRFRRSDGPTDWRTVCGGDGGFCAADQTDPLYFYGEQPNLTIFRNTNGGEPFTKQFIYAGIADAGGANANFVAPFVLDPNNPNTLLAGGASLWRSTNVKDNQPSWVAIKSPIPGPVGVRNISAIAVAQGNSGFIWVGHNDGSIYYTTNGTDPAPDVTWTQANHGPLPLRQCSRITIQAPLPDDPEVPGGRKIYATFAGFYSSSSDSNVWRTQNNGGNWTNISNGLPKVPIFSLVISPSSPDRLYIGTETGVFASANGGTAWSPSNGGPANVVVTELFWMGPNKLVAATYGRGMFTLGPVDQ